MFSCLKKKDLCTSLTWLQLKYWKIQLFSGAISHGTSNEPETYLESSGTSMREISSKNSQQLQAGLGERKMRLLLHASVHTILKT